MKSLILVSSCLMGQSVRYDGRHSACDKLWEKLKDEPYMALCPELLGGLTIPRSPAKIVGATYGQEGLDVLQNKAKLINAQGYDVTRAFVEGSRLVLEAAKRAKVTHCYLKDRSPSCGYDPKGENPKGGPAMGVLTALLLNEGIKVTEVRALASPR